MQIKIIDYFLPADYRGVVPTDLETAEVMRKYRLNIVFCLTIGVLVSFIFLARVLLDTKVSNSIYLNLIVIAACFLLPFGIKKFSLRDSVFYFGISLSTIVVFWRSLDTGGVTSPVTTWLTIFPLIGLLIVGFRVALVTYVGVCTLFFVLGFHETLSLDVVTYTTNPVIKPLVLSFVTLVVFFLAYLFERQRKHNEAVIMKIEKELSSNKKLASLGGLSGGLAHEINNPLTILAGRIFSLNRMIKDGDIDKEKMMHACESAEESVRRIDSIVNALRTFSRDEYVEDLKDVNVAGLIKDCIRSFEHEDQIIIKNKCDGDYCLVKGNAVLLQRVFTNLITNSLHAVKETNKPWIEIEVINKTPLELSFKDSGGGISEELAERVMEPFFTTKSVGEGSGLGLALSQNIMRLHGGALKINSESKNTEFRVVFPKEN